MSGVLDNIVRAKQREVHGLKHRTCYTRVPDGPRKNVATSLRRAAGQPLRLIAENKRKSPSAGALSTVLSTAERVVRYGHTSVLVARPGIPTGKILVATDFTEASMPAVRFAAMLVAKTTVDATLLHVMQLPTPPLASFAAAFGSPWMPPTEGAVQQLERWSEAIGVPCVKGAAGGDPAAVLVARAAALNAEMLVMGSRGHSAIARLVLGSTAEKVIRHSEMSVLVVR